MSHWGKKTEALWSTHYKMDDSNKYFFQGSRIYSEKVERSQEPDVADDFKKALCSIYNKKWAHRDYGSIYKIHMYSRQSPSTVQWISTLIKKLSSNDTYWLMSNKTISLYILNLYPLEGPPVVGQWNWLKEKQTFCVVVMIYFSYWSLLPCFDFHLLLFFLLFKNSLL